MREKEARGDWAGIRVQLEDQKEKRLSPSEIEADKDLAGLSKRDGAYKAIYEDQQGKIYALSRRDKVPKFSL